MRVARLSRAKVIANDLLHGSHNIVVENAVHEADAQRRLRIGGQEPSRSRMAKIEMLDDDRRFHQSLIAIA